MRTFAYLLALSLLLFSGNLFAQITIAPTFENEGSLIRVDFPYQNFEDIVSMQFTIEYNPSALQFQSFGLSNLDGLTEASIGLVEPGIITLSWFDMTLAGITLPPGTSTHSIYFVPLTNSESVINISDIPTPIEFSDNNFQNIPSVSSIPLTIVPDPNDICAEIIVTNLTCFEGTDGCIQINPIFGVPPYTYSWSNGQQTSEICNLSSSNYQVTITSANSAICIRNVSVSQPASRVASIDMMLPPEFCSSVSLDANISGLGNFDYLWSTGETTEIINNVLLSEIYSVSITDDAGCVTTSTITIPEKTCDSIYIQPIQATFGNEFRVDFVVEEFDLISGLAYTMRYDKDELELTGVGNFGIANMVQDNFITLVPGKVNFFWDDISMDGVTLPDGSVLYSLYFTALGENPSTVDIFNFNSYAMTSPNSIFVHLITEPISVLENGNLLKGTLYLDDNENCVNDAEQGLNQHVITITDGVDIWNVVTDNGTYSIVLPEGIYEVAYNPIDSNIWSPCQESYTVEFTVGDTEVLDIGVEALLDCVDMEVDITIPFLRRCFPNSIYVEYCNYGSIAAEDVTVDIELDPDMSLVLTANSPQPISNNENTYTYEVGDIAFGECGAFYIQVILDQECNETILGQTHCVTGTIYPNEPCVVNPLWSGASLDVTGSCDGQNVNFVIENVGNANMTQASSFIVIEDHVMGQSIPEDFILAAGENLTISHPANGSTYIMNLNQVPYHPGNSTPNVAVEGCGINDEGEISLGIVTMFNMGDGDGFEDIECIENIGSYDPNDKRATVSGFGDENYIYANEQMEYLVRFQNTGTDTAFNIVIKDELSPNYEITSIRPGASSHAYTYRIEGERTMVFTFENIMLPDSTTDLVGSNGFISYKVDQLLDLEDGTVLENTADIYFDFNEAIVTNTTTHTIGSDFIMTSTFFIEGSSDENAISVYPNPSTENITFELDQVEDNLSLEIFDITGKLILTKEFDQEKIILSKDGLTEGMYFYSINQNSKQLTSGKFIFL